MERKNFYGSGNESFGCKNCGAHVEKLTNGSFRNHCPECLYSRHVDKVPGDRASDCKGLMEPIRAEQHPKKGWMIVHKCKDCGEEGRNTAALNDIQPDNLERLIRLMNQ